MDGMEDDSDQPAEAEAKVNSRIPVSVRVQPKIRLRMRTPSCRVYNIFDVIRGVIRSPFVHVNIKNRILLARV